MMRTAFSGVRGTFTALSRIYAHCIMTIESRYGSLVLMDESSPPEWAFLTNHAQVLICITHDPSIRLRDIGERLGITERAAHRIVDALAAAGYITRQRNGRRNHYTINAHLPLPDAIAREQSIGELLEILTAPHGSMRPVDRAEHNNVIQRVSAS
jgi:DNA-binding MarR family transcriptional regulator